MTAIKLCGFTRPEDARVAVLAGANAIGLVFASSPRQVTVQQAKKIIRVLPATILRVGVFVNQDPGWVLGVYRDLGLDRLQFHGSESRRMLRLFPQNRIIRALKPGANTPAPTTDPAPEASVFLVDAAISGQAGGTGRLANWKYARGLKKFHKPIILSGGLNPENVGRAIRAVKPDMVDVSSGIEIRPGIKGAEKMRAFILAVRQAEK
jgi:phosphoribosylanthranilate isomerase